MWFCAFYQLVALYGFKELVKYRFIVSRINKLVIIAFLMLLIMLFYRRLSVAGRFCSGDHLTSEEWYARWNPHHSKELLVKMGFILNMYVRVVTGLIVIAIVAASFIAWGII